MQRQCYLLLASVWIKRAHCLRVLFKANRRRFAALRQGLNDALYGATGTIVEVAANWW